MYCGLPNKNPNRVFLRFNKNLHDYAGAFESVMHKLPSPVPADDTCSEDDDGVSDDIARRIGCLRVAFPSAGGGEAGEES